MPKTWEESEAIGSIAGGLIANYHPELGTARMLYVFVSETPSKGGRELYGRVKKLAGFNEWAIEKDFIVEIAAPLWNDLDPNQRSALVDHFLERCVGEEDEKTGTTKWKLRDPDVQEFSSILDRHGAWNTQLAGFVSVAKKVNLEGFIEEEETNLNDVTVKTSEAGPAEADGEADLFEDA